MFDVCKIELIQALYIKEIEKNQQSLLLQLLIYIFRYTASMIFSGAWYRKDIEDYLMILSEIVDIYQQESHDDMINNGYNERCYSLIENIQSDLNSIFIAFNNKVKTALELLITHSDKQIIQDRAKARVSNNISLYFSNEAEIAKRASDKLFLSGICVLFLWIGLMCYIAFSLDSINLLFTYIKLISVAIPLLTLSTTLFFQARKRFNQYSLYREYEIKVRTALSYTDTITSKDDKIKDLQIEIARTYFVNIIHSLDVKSKDTIVPVKDLLNILQQLNKSFDREKERSEHNK